MGGRNHSEIKLDEHPRYEKSGSKLKLAIGMEDLAKLRPAFSKDRSVTTEDSSGINDGAAYFINQQAKGKRTKPQTQVALVGSIINWNRPTILWLWSRNCDENLLKRFGLVIEDIGLELNEAFAADYWMYAKIRA